MKAYAKNQIIINDEGRRRVVRRFRFRYWESTGQRRVCSGAKWSVVNPH